MAAVRILVLVIAGLGLARAGPVPTSKPATTQRSCDIGRFKSLSPSELEAFKKAKDALVGPSCCGLTWSPPTVADLLSCYGGLTSLLLLWASL